MIFFEFYGSVIEGQTDVHRDGEALFGFRLQYPIREGVPFNPPTLNGEALREVARVRNRAMGKDTGFALEFEIHEPGELVIESYMSLTSSQPSTFRIGVQITEDGIRVTEAAPQAFQWFIDGDFVEAGEDGARSILIPSAEGGADGAGDTDPGGIFAGSIDFDELADED